MKVAYVDSSAVVGLLFEEPGHEQIADAVAGFERVFSANLLDAEVRAAAMRESVAEEPGMRFLDRIDWVLPDRPLSRELSRVLVKGYLRGADLWHLACALYLRGSHAGAQFLTLDQRQRDLARRMGFRTP